MNCPYPSAYEETTSKTFDRSTEALEMPADDLILPPDQIQHQALLALLAPVADIKEQYALH